MRKLLVLLVLALPWCALADGTTPRTIAITFDDLPFVERGLPLETVRSAHERLVAALERHRVPAIGFVNEDKLLRRGGVDARIALLERWLEAGLELGNHGFGHLDLNATPLPQYQEAVLKGEVVTRWLLASRKLPPPRWYRHPFTRTGSTPDVRQAFEAFLAQHGYAVAPFTVEHDDFLFDAVYSDALRRGDTALAAKVRAAYVAHLDPALDTFESMSRDLFGREIPQVLLIHASPLNADAIDAMLTRLAERGYRFVSLAEALRDPAYASPDGYAGPHGPSWLRRWSLGLGRPTTKKGQPDPPDWVQAAYDGLSK